MVDKPDMMLATSGSVPVPDPTVLTTELVDRAIAAYKAVMEERLGAMDKAVVLVATQIAEIAPNTTAAQELMHKELDRRMHSEREFMEMLVGRIEEVFNEKFSSVEGTFASNALALTAALAAQKEAAAESNKSGTLAIATAAVNTQKQIDAQGVLLTTNTKSLEGKISDINKNFDDKFADVKGRLDMLAGHSTGINAAWGILLGAVGLLGSLVALFAVFKA